VSGWGVKNIIPLAISILRAVGAGGHHTVVGSRRRETTFDGAIRISVPARPRMTFSAGDLAPGGPR